MRLIVLATLIVAAWASLTLLARSYRAWDDFSLLRVGVDGKKPNATYLEHLTIGSRPGLLSLRYGRDVASIPPTVDERQPAVWAERSGGPVSTPWSPVDALPWTKFHFNRFGFAAMAFDQPRGQTSAGWTSFPGPRDAGQQTGWYVAAPHWVLAIPVALPLLWAARRILQRRRRQKAGLCVACGFDLRATPACCPECGLAVRNTTESSSTAPRSVRAIWIRAAVMSLLAWSAAVLAVYPADGTDQLPHAERGHGFPKPPVPELEVAWDSPNALRLGVRNLHRFDYCHASPWWFHGTDDSTFPARFSLDDLRMQPGTRPHCIFDPSSRHHRDLATILVSGFRAGCGTQTNVPKLTPSGMPSATSINAKARVTADGEVDLAWFDVSCCAAYIIERADENGWRPIAVVPNETRRSSNHPPLTFGYYSGASSADQMNAVRYRDKEVLRGKLYAYLVRRADRAPEALHTGSVQVSIPAAATVPTKSEAKRNEPLFERGDGVPAAIATSPEVSVADASAAAVTADPADYTASEAQWLGFDTPPAPVNPAELTYTLTIIPLLGLLILIMLWFVSRFVQSLYPRIVPVIVAFTVCGASTILATPRLPSTPNQRTVTPKHGGYEISWELPHGETTQFIVEGMETKSHEWKTAATAVPGSRQIFVSADLIQSATPPDFSITLRTWESLRLVAVNGVGRSSPTPIVVPDQLRFWHLQGLAFECSATKEGVRVEGYADTDRD